MRIPEIREYNGVKVLYVDDQPFYMQAGELHNSSSSSMKYLQPILERLAELHFNSVLLPVTWQMVEPKQGQYNFTLVKQIIDSADKLGLKLGILWFGTWKNAQCSYCPAWVKRDTETHIRAQVKKGKPFFNRPSGLMFFPYTTISPFSTATMEADAAAFAALMAFIRDNDPNQTVITVQVENETGFLGGDMDYCDQSIAKYEQAVPEEFLEYLKAHTENMDAALKKQLKKNKKGTWEQVFGDLAHDVFITYYTASYVNYVAAAGKAEYPLPMSANCWMNTKGAKPGKYPTGGPVAKNFEIWQYAAPNIDIFAPDLYLDDFAGGIKEYTKNGNPAYIPESKLCAWTIGRNVHMLANRNAMCYATFGIDDVDHQMPVDMTFMGPLAGFAVGTRMGSPVSPKTLGLSNKLLKGALPVILEKYGTDDMVAFSKEWDGYVNKATFGDYEIRSVFLPSPKKDGTLLILKLEEDEFLFFGYMDLINFKSLNKDRPYVQHLSIEEGEYVDGEWQTTRVLNGDEEMALIHLQPTLMKVKVDCYK